MKPEHKKYVLENLRKKTITQLSNDLNLDEGEIEKFLEENQTKQPDRISALFQKAALSMNAQIVLLVLAALGFLIYSNIIHSPFQFDDDGAIVNNHFIHDLSNIQAIWNAFNTRFIVGLSLAFNYSIGKLDVLGYHLFNIAGHVLASFLVYLFVGLTFKTPRLSKTHWVSYGRQIAFFSSLIFLSHPVQTQAVTYVWQRAASMAAVFYLAALVFYIKARLKSSGAYYGISMIAAVLGMFTKETTITLPLAITMYEFFFFGRWNEDRQKRFAGLLPFLFMLAIIPMTLMRADQITLPLMKPQIAKLDRSSAPSSLNFMDVTRFVEEERMPRPVYIFTQINVLRTYLRLFCMPLRQNLDYDYPLSRSLMETTTFLSLALLVTLLVIGAYLFQKHPLISFGIFWFFLTLSVESMVPQNDVIFEHRLYLPMIGLSLLLASIAYLLFGKRSIKATTIALLLFVVVNSALTYRRNLVWKDGFTLWNNVVSKSPHKARPYSNRGAAYLQMGKNDLALADFNKAIEIYPYSEVYNNRGEMYRLRGDYDQAAVEFKKAIELDPKYVPAYVQLGFVEDAKGKHEQAIADYTKAIQLNPYYMMAYNNRGLSYKTKGNLDQASIDFNKAIEIDPTFWRSYYNRGGLYKEKGLVDEALKDYAMAIKINPNCAEAYYQRGAIYDIKGKLDQAIADYNKAIEIDPLFSEFYNSRLKESFAKGDYDKVITECNNEVKATPNFAGAYYNRATFYKSKGDHDQAIADYTKAIQLNPRYAMAYGFRGISHEAKGNHEQAIADCIKAAQIGSYLGGIYYNLGVVAQAQCKYDLAISSYSREIKAASDFMAKAYGNRGRVHETQGNHDQAIADYTKAIEIDPRYDKAYNNRGNAVQSNGLFDQAIADYSKAVEISPNYAIAYSNRAVAYFTKKEYDKSWQDVHKAEALGVKMPPRFLDGLKKASGREA